MNEQTSISAQAEERTPACFKHHWGVVTFNVLECASTFLQKNSRLIPYLNIRTFQLRLKKLKGNLAIGRFELATGTDSQPPDTPKAPPVCRQCPTATLTACVKPRTQHQDYVISRPSPTLLSASRPPFACFIEKPSTGRSPF